MWRGLRNLSVLGWQKLGSWNYFDEPYLSIWLYLRIVRFTAGLNDTASSLVPHSSMRNSGLAPPLSCVASWWARPSGVDGRSSAAEVEVTLPLPTKHFRLDTSNSNWIRLHRFPSDRGAYSVKCFEHIPVGWWASSAATYCPSDARYSWIFNRKISTHNRMGNGVQRYSSTLSQLLVTVVSKSVKSCKWLDE